MKEYFQKTTIGPEVISSAFLEACHELDDETLKILLETGHVDCNQTDDINNYTCLHSLATVGKLEIIKIAIEYGVIQY